MESYKRRNPGGKGFTLIELLVSVAILIILIGVLGAVTTLVSQTWKTSAGGVGSFQKARSAFDALTQTLSQATLNTYSDYVDVNGYPRTANVSSESTFVPVGYARASELHFLCGYGATLAPPGSYSQGGAVFFQAPLGRSSNSAYSLLNSSLNSVGFYIAYTDDSTNWPAFVTATQPTNYRFRLMEWLPPLESNQIYAATSTTVSGVPAYNQNWIPWLAGQTVANTLTLADDITLLVILPKLNPADEYTLNNSQTLPAPTSAASYAGTLLCPSYQYDSRVWASGYNTPITGTYGYPTATATTYKSLMRNQIPPLVDVVMIAVAEKDALRLQKLYPSASPTGSPLVIPAGTFQTSSSLPSDLALYETALTNAHVTYKVFTETVQLQGAKWSNLATQ